MSRCTCLRLANINCNPLDVPVQIHTLRTKQKLSLFNFVKLFSFFLFGVRNVCWTWVIQSRFVCIEPEKDRNTFKSYQELNSINGYIWGWDGNGVSPDSCSFSLELEPESRQACCRLISPASLRLCVREFTSDNVPGRAVANVRHLSNQGQPSLNSPHIECTLFDNQLQLTFGNSKDN